MGLSEGVSKVPPPQRSARLYRALVDGGFASAVNAGLVPTEQPFLYTISVTATEGSSLASVEEATLAQLDAVRRHGISGHELDKAKNQLRASGTFGRQTTYQMAEEVQHFALFHVSPEEINTDLDRYSAVTLDDLRRVAQKYLVLANSTAIVVNPVAGAGESGGHQHEEDE